MLTVLHFLELRSFFRDQEDHVAFPVTVEKLTGIWHCTPRYTKMIIRKLSELGWIEWQAGRGRGHTSLLTIQADAEEILVQEGKLKMERGEVNEAMELMNRFGSSSAKNRLMDWLSDGMGFSTQMVSDRLEDTLRFPVYRNIVTLDPALSYYTFDAHIGGQLFNTLVEYDPDRRTIQPSIAHFWETSEDGRSWTFHLKKSILFHHGRELTAHDVVFSIDRVRLRPERFESSWMFRDIEQVVALDHKTVHFQLKQANSLFLRFLSTVPASILPEDVVLRKGEADFSRNPVGTGPFQVTRMQDGICVLEAFPGHFRGRPQLDRVEILILPDMEPGRLKEPDWTSVFTSYGDPSHGEWGERLSQSCEWIDTEMLFACCTLLVFNQWKVGPQNHPAFRRALHHMIDRKQMIDDLGGDLVVPALGFRPHHAYTGRAEKEEEALSRAQILALLEESGYRGEVFRVASNPYHVEDALWIRDRLESFGIEVVMDVRCVEELMDYEDWARYDCRLFGNVFTGDEICELEMYLQKNYFLAAFDPQTTQQVRQLTEEIFREEEGLRRQEMLDELEELMKQTHSILYLVYKKSNTSFHQSVRGVSINTSGWLDFDKIWFHPQTARS
ncbi:SgrR family transcriptional regulator [Brevibacillus choshinensis]|uniref:SgrR family transcriptional regulator n=1 Tax=Brevibacillus choshinensis TaxID=54911 RepID=A0ABX7FNB6_BRECH|nr:SgrR family transcriptional regulator [Brevibacillus choshinensis]QRG67637.1 SgrR family transcriptional regulator [Brevibacillus choshinensis]